MQGEYQSLKEEHIILKNKVEVEHETKRQAAEVTFKSTISSSTFSEMLKINNFNDIFFVNLLLLSH